MATRRTSYHPSGQVAAEWGDQIYPTYKLYNLRGQMRELRTYQNQTSKPTSSTPGYATTTWNYEPATGLLLSKLDANSKGASYTYTADGKLLTRTWARTSSGAPLSTSYTYTPAGQLFTTDYSDTTPDVSIRYDRLGRQLTQTNGLATSTFAYDPATLALDTETITYDLNADGTADFTRVLDRSSDDLGRDKGFQLKNGSTVENEAKYGYHATTARLTEISNPQISNLKFTYDYVGNSSLIDAITGPVHSVDLIWEPTRNVLEKRENQFAGNEVSGYQYRVNELGQRTGVTQTGSVFAAGQAIAWGYDALGQVTSASAPGTDADRAYQYDTIGNRVEAREEITAVTGTPNYTANALNQYTAVGNQVPAHDDDGNLRLDGGVNKDNEPREYVWDAENRLISVKRVSDGAPIVTYQYDSQSRRISRSEGVSSAPSTAYLYDAWNCIAEYSIQHSAFTLQHSRLWGLDLSGTLQGAGGVGGMLCESQISNPQITNYYPTYDGNGNISEYLAQTGAPVARFEYDPFGNTVVNTDAANQFAYRFSTKPADAATGLYYYGYRYYDPVTGRWPSRDPIGERGGMNLYGFVGNGPTSSQDYLGMIDLLNPWSSSKLYPNAGQRPSDVEALFDALKKLESVKGKLDGKICFSIKIYRDASNRNTVLSATSGNNCDIIYSVMHGNVDAQNPNRRRQYPGHIVDPKNQLKNTIIVEAFDFIAKNYGKEFLPFGCYTAPDRNHETTGKSMFKALTESILSRSNSTQDCCSSAKKVCLFFGHDDRRDDLVLAPAPYPESWRP